MSNCSFSHSVIKRLVSQGPQKVSLCGNGLTLSKTSPCLLAQLFSEKTQGIAVALALSLCHRCHCCSKTLTIWIISVITEDNLLETQNMCSLSKEQSILSREIIQNAFFSELCCFYSIKGDNSECIFFSPELCCFFDLDFVFSIKQPTVECWHLHAMLLFLHVCSTSLLKTLWDKKKLFLMINFSISLLPKVSSTLLGNFPPFSSNLKSSSENCQFGTV